MKRKLQIWMCRGANYLELLVSGVLVIVLTILSIQLLISLFYLGEDWSNEAGLLNTDLLSYYMEKTLNIAVGVEFVKMLGKHTPITVIEVLLFATARQMIVEHLSVEMTLIGILSIAVLFFIRKYLLRNEDAV